MSRLGANSPNISALPDGNIRRLMPNRASRLRKESSLALEHGYNRVEYKSDESCNFGDVVGSTMRYFKLAGLIREYYPSAKHLTDEEIIRVIATKNIDYSNANATEEEMLEVLHYFSLRAQQRLGLFEGQDVSTIDDYQQKILRKYGDAHMTGGGIFDVCGRVRAPVLDGRAAFDEPRTYYYKGLTADDVRVPEAQVINKINTYFAMYGIAKPVGDTDIPDINPNSYGKRAYAFDYIQENSALYEAIADCQVGIYRELKTAINSFKRKQVQEYERLTLIVVTIYKLAETELKSGAAAGGDIRSFAALYQIQDEAGLQNFYDEILGLRLLITNKYGNNQPMPSEINQEVFNKLTKIVASVLKDNKYNSNDYTNNVVKLFLDPTELPENTPNSKSLTEEQDNINSKINFFKNTLKTDVVTLNEYYESKDEIINTFLNYFYNKCIEVETIKVESFFTNMKYRFGPFGNYDIKLEKTKGTININKPAREQIVAGPRALANLQNRGLNDYEPTRESYRLLFIQQPHLFVGPLFSILPSKEIEDAITQKQELINRILINDQGGVIQSMTNEGFKFDRVLTSIILRFDPSQISEVLSYSNELARLLIRAQLEQTGTLGKKTLEPSPKKLTPEEANLAKAEVEQKGQTTRMFITAAKSAMVTGITGVTARSTLIPLMCTYTGSEIGVCAAAAGTVGFATAVPLLLGTALIGTAGYGIYQYTVGRKVSEIQRLLQDLNSNTFNLSNPKKSSVKALVKRALARSEFDKWEKWTTQEKKSWAVKAKIKAEMKQRIEMEISSMIENYLICLSKVKGLYEDRTVVGQALVGTAATVGQTVGLTGPIPTSEDTCIRELDLAVQRYLNTLRASPSTVEFTGVYRDMIIDRFNNNDYLNIKYSKGPDPSVVTLKKVKTAAEVAADTSTRAKNIAGHQSVALKAAKAGNGVGVVDAMAQAAVASALTEADIRRARGVRKTINEASIQILHPVLPDAANFASAKYKYEEVAESEETCAEIGGQFYNGKCFEPKQKVISVDMKKEQCGLDSKYKEGYRVLDDKCYLIPTKSKVNSLKEAVGLAGGARSLQRYSEPSTVVYNTPTPKRLTLRLKNETAKKLTVFDYIADKFKGRDYSDEMRLLLLINDPLYNTLINQYVSIFNDINNDFIGLVFPNVPLAAQMSIFNRQEGGVGKFGKAAATENRESIPTNKRAELPTYIPRTNKGSVKLPAYQKVTLEDEIKAIQAQKRALQANVNAEAAQKMRDMNALTEKLVEARAVGKNTSAAIMTRGARAAGGIIAATVAVKSGRWDLVPAAFKLAMSDDAVSKIANEVIVGEVDKYISKQEQKGKNTTAAAAVTKEFLKDVDLAVGPQRDIADRYKFVEAQYAKLLQFNEDPNLALIRVDRMKTVVNELLTMITEKNERIKKQKAEIEAGGKKMEEKLLAELTLNEETRLPKITNIAENLPKIKAELEKLQEDEPGEAYRSSISTAMREVLTGYVGMTGVAAAAAKPKPAREMAAAAAEKRAAVVPATAAEKRAAAAVPPATVPPATVPPAVSNSRPRRSTGIVSGPPPKNTTEGGTHKRNKTTRSDKKIKQKKFMKTRKSSTKSARATRKGSK